MTEAERDEISDKISNLFEGRTLDDVSAILTIQLGMLVLQGAADAEDAADFLDEIVQNVEGMIESFEFPAAEEADPISKS